MNKKEDIDAKLFITEDMKEDFDRIMNTPTNQHIRKHWIDLGLDVEIYDKYFSEYLKDESVLTIGISSLFGMASCRKQMDDKKKKELKGEVNDYKKCIGSNNKETDKKKDLEDRWKKVKEEYSLLGEDYPDDLFEEMEKLKIEKPKAFEHRLKILERKEPELDVPLWTATEMHIGSNWDIGDNEFDEDKDDKD